MSDFHDVQFELVKIGQRSFIAKARLITPELRSVEAHGSGKTIEEAEDDAYKKAKARLPWLKIEVGKAPSTSEATQSVKEPTNGHHKTSLAPGDIVLPMARAALNPQDTPETASEPSPSIQTSLLDRAKQLANEKNINEQDIIILTGRCWTALDSAGLNGLIERLSTGPTEEDVAKASSLGRLFDQAGVRTLDDLRSVWNEIKKNDWPTLSPWSRMLANRAKETAKAELAKNPSSLPIAPPDGEATRCRSTKCNGLIKWITVAGKRIPLNYHSHSAMLEGDGPAQMKRWVQLKGSWQFVDCWASPPGQRGSVPSYSAHTETCLDPSYFQRERTAA